MLAGPPARLRFAPYTATFGGNGTMKDREQALTPVLPRRARRRLAGKVTANSRPGPARWKYRAGHHGAKNMLDDGQPQARAPRLARERLRITVEALGQARDVLGSDTEAGVTHGKTRRPPVAATAR